MTALRQRHVAVRWGLVLASLVVPVLVFVLVISRLPSGYSWQRWAVGIVFVVLFLYGGVQPLIWWLGADLVVDARGVLFGASRERRRPGQVTFVARNPWLVPWEAVSDVRLVRDPAAVRAMRKAARGTGGPPQPTTYLGYFPARGRAALCLTVDPGKVTVPPVRAPSSRPKLVGAPGSGMRTSSTWAFPVRSVEPLVDALRAHGVGVTETTEPQLPEPVLARGLPSPDDPVVIRTLTENLGRPPTEEELAEIRRTWYDTQRYPRGSAD